MRNPYIIAEYTSVFDDGDVTCSSECVYNSDTKLVYDIAEADNADEAALTNCLTDEYVTLPDGTILRESDGISFAYKNESEYSEAELLEFKNALASISS